MDIVTATDAELVDALIQLDRTVSQYDTFKDGDSQVRVNLLPVLDLTNPGWRDDEVIVNWIYEQGVKKASEMLLNRHLK